MDFGKLETILEGEPKYRFKQAWEAIFVNLIDDWSLATNLPPKLREKLNKELPLNINSKVTESVVRDVVKTTITLNDGLEIETVLMRHKGGRSTVCVSSQVGCSMGCKFCATGAMGFKRDLTVGEIVNQVLFFTRFLRARNEERVNNIVFMGMGEPFLNYDNVLSAIRIFNDKDGLNIGARRISISTSGVVEGIERLADEDLQVNLAISLHASNDDLRSKLMPMNKKYPLVKILNAVDDYIKKTSRQVMFEYVLLDGINDTKEHAKELGKVMNKSLYFVNLIIYNKTGMEGMKPSTKRSIEEFKEVLNQSGTPFSQRYHFGSQIKAACGQLAP